MQLAPLLPCVGQHLGPEENVTPHLGIQLHDLLWCIIASTNEIVEAVAEVSVPELGLKPGSSL